MPLTVTVLCFAAVSNRWLNYCFGCSGKLDWKERMKMVMTRKMLIMKEARLVKRRTPRDRGSDIQSKIPKQNSVSQNRSAKMPFTSKSVSTPKLFNIFGIVVLKRTQ